MSAGTAIMAVVRAYDATGDMNYLDAGWHFAQEVLALGDANGDEIWFRHYHEAPVAAGAQLRPAHDLRARASSWRPRATPS